MTPSPDTVTAVESARASPHRPPVDLEGIGGDGVPVVVDTHVRRHGPGAHGDRIAIASYLGGGTAFDTAVAEWAEHYADQTEEDFAVLQRAVSDGRIVAQPGV